MIEDRLTLSHVVSPLFAAELPDRLSKSPARTMQKEFTDILCGSPSGTQAHRQLANGCFWPRAYVW
jgi:hypothetical protein